MATAKEAHVLSSYYAKAYKYKYGEAAVLNRNTARWNFDNILADLTTNEVKELIDYYLETTNTVQNKKHSLDWFFYNYTDLMTNKREQAADAERRAKLREESKQRAEEWLNSGKSRIADNFDSK